MWPICRLDSICVSFGMCCVPDLCLQRCLMSARGVAPFVAFLLVTPPVRVVSVADAAVRLGGRVMRAMLLCPDLPWRVAALLSAPPVSPCV